MTSEYRDAIRRVVAEAGADPAGARRALRELLFALLDSDSEERAEMFWLLTPDEQRAFKYRWHTIPSLARVDPNRLPPSPFPDPMMKRLLKSASEKVMIFQVEGLLDDEET